MCEGEAGMVVAGAVEELPAGAAGVVVLTVAGDAVAGAHAARELLEVKVDEFAWMRARGAAHRGWRLQRGEACAMAAQQA